MTDKDAYYFPHDSNAQHDDKIMLLRLRHGWAGYGIYWAVIEKLRDSRNYKIPSSSRIGLEASLTEIQASLKQCSSNAQASLEQACEVLKAMLEIGLLVDDGESLFSPALLVRMEHLEQKRDRLREAGRLGGIASSNCRKSQGENSSIAQASLKHRLSIAQASKVKKSTEEKNNTLAAEAATGEKESQEPKERKSTCPAGLTYFGTAFLKKAGVKYMASFKKDVPLMQEIEKTYGDQVPALIDRFFDSEDKFIKEAGYSVGVFRAVIHKLVYVDPDIQYKQEMKKLGVEVKLK